MDTFLPFLAAILTALLSTGVAVLAYTRSKRVDAVAEQAGIRTDASHSIDQVVTGLNNLVSALQVDNNALRGVVENLEAKIVGLHDEIIKLRQEVRDALNGRRKLDST